MTIIKSTSLFYTEGSSDKVYHAQLAQVDGGFVVNFQYGRRNSTLQTGTKTTEPTSQEKAEKVFSKLLSEKIGKGYTEQSSGEVFSTETFVAKKTSLVPQLLNPIEEEDVESYLTNDEYVAQEKHNGERRPVIVEDGKATGVNRKGLNVPLPDSLNKSFKKNMEVDSEIIGDNLFVWDIMALDGEDLKSKPLVERIKILEKQKFGKNVTVGKTAYTTAEKRAMLKKIQDENGEGIVFKKKTASYTGGRPTSGGNNLKYKLYKTATFIVANHTENKRSVGLVVLEGKKEVEVGKVTILPNFPVPEVGALVEVRYLYAYKGGAVYQPIYLGERTDLEREDAKIEQLVYKAS